MELWKILLLLALWIVCHLLVGVMWALGHREKRKPQCPLCLGRCGYGQKSASIPAPPPIQVVLPIPKAPSKGMGADEIRARIIRDIEFWAKTRR